MRVLRSRWLWWPVGTVVALIVAVIVVFNVTAYPGAMLTRYVFDKGSEGMRDRNEQFAVPDKVTVTRNVEYLPADSTVDRGKGDDTKLDIYLPKTVADGELLGTLVWIHGGGWVSGDKADSDFYFEQLASNGFAVVSLNYSRAPQRQYPTAIKQLNAALGFLNSRGADYHVDAKRLVLAGDSAGAQLSSQLAGMITNEEFASQVGVTPAVSREQLKGIALNCGVYDVNALENTGHGSSTTTLSRILTWGVDNTLWAYGGQRSGNPTMVDQMSTIDHLTATYPPVWISAGNDDPLTATQTVPFVAKLREVGASPQTLVYGADEPAKLGHEFQFELGTPQGQEALRQTVAFVQKVTA